MRRWLAALLLALFALPLHAEERIRDFCSDVRVARDGTLTVIETIRVASEGEAIKRGIFRDFPTSYRNRLGQRTRVGFEVQSVTRDGQPEPFAIENLSNGKRVRTGSRDIFLDRGDHSYVITYTTTRQLRFDRTFDELYWNATGNGWQFPIDFASVRITLPVPARIGQRASYTGAQGSMANDAEVWDEGPGFIAFRTTRPLAAGEGLTVAAAFPKGVVDAPSSASRAGWWLQDWAPLATAVIALAALLFYQLRAWWVAGRGPPAGTVVPLFAPPDGLSAAATRYVARMGMDDRAFTAAIVQSAVARQLSISKQDGGWFAADTTTLTRTRADLRQPVARAEARMVDALFPGGAVTLELKQENHSLLQAARTALGETLAEAHLGTHYVRNTSWAVLGLLGIPVALFAVAIVTALVGASDPGAAFGAPLGGLIAVGVLFLALRLIRGHRGLLMLLGWLIAICCAFVIFGTSFAALVLAVEAGSWALLLPLLSLPVALLAFKWMEAPTPEGRRVMDRIAGFKHYLGITEEARLDSLHPPEKTPELFEKYLPYAIALDVENRWADRFSGVLAAAAATGSTAGHMA